MSKEQLIKKPDNSGSLSKLLRKGAIGLLIKLSSGVLAFAMALTMSRALSDIEYGQFATLLSAALFFGLLTTFGQPMLVLRFLGKYQNSTDAPYARGVLKRSLEVVTLGSLVVAIICLVATSIAVWAFGVDALSYWFYFVPLFMSMALAEYYAHVLRSFQSLFWALAPRDVIWRGLVVLIAIGISISSANVSAEVIILTIGVLLLVLVICQARIANQYRDRTLEMAVPQYDSQAWDKAALGLWGTKVLGFSFPHLAVLLISLLMGNIEGGLFFTALRIVGLMSLPLTAINMVAAPDIAKAYHSTNGQKDVQDICRASMIILIPSVCIILLVLGLFSGVALSWFGTATTAVQPALLILALGFAINTLSGSTGILMQLTGHERQFLLFSGASNALALIGIFVLVPVYGLVGAAICSAFATCGWNVAAIIWSRRNLGIDPSALVFILGHPT